MDENNERVMRRAFEEIMARGNVEIIDELFATRLAGHDTTGGRSDARSSRRACRDASPPSPSAR